MFSGVVHEGITELQGTQSHKPLSVQSGVVLTNELYTQ